MSSNIKIITHIPADIPQYVSHFQCIEELVDQIPTGAFVIARLSELSLDIPEHIAIATVLYREVANAVLVFKRDESFTTPLAQVLNKTCKIYVNNAIEKSQVSELFPNAEIKIQKKSLADTLSDSEATLTYKNELPSAGNKWGSEYSVFDVKPMEIVPKPASGVLVGLCNASDLEMRRCLAKHHNKEVAHLSNVERGFLKKSGMSPERLAVYCEKDIFGVYHAYVAFINPKDNNLVKISYAQSTFAGLSDKLYEYLENC